MDFQFLCDLHIPPDNRLYNYKIVSAVRREIASNLNIGRMQDILMDSWLPFINDLDSISCDATHYGCQIIMGSCGMVLCLDEILEQGSEGKTYPDKVYQMA